MNVLTLNILNRDVRIGCLYDYNNAEILPEKIEIPSEESEDIDIEPRIDPPAEIRITTDVSEKGRLSCIGINQHLRRHLEAKKFEMNRLWFYNFLKDESLNCCNDNEVHIIAYIKYSRIAKCLMDHFVSSNIWRCHNHDGGTHLIQEVDYGAEFVLWMHKPVDTSKETKQFVEKSIHIALENYLEQLFDFHHKSPPISHKAFDTMTCSFHSSIPNGCISNGKFEECIQRIQELIELSDRQNLWHPVEMRLGRIPTEEEIRTCIEFNEDVVLELRQKNKWIAEQCHQLIDSPYLQRLPFLKTHLFEFQKLLEPMTSRVNYVANQLDTNYFSQSKTYRVTERCKTLLTNAFDWLKRFHEEVEMIHSVLEGNSLPALDLRSIQELIQENRDVKRTRVFVLHFSCVTTDLRKRFKKWTNYPWKE